MTGVSFFTNDNRLTQQRHEITKIRTIDTHKKVMINHDFNKILNMVRCTGEVNILRFSYNIHNFTITYHFQKLDGGNKKLQNFSKAT